MALPPQLASSASRLLAALAFAAAVLSNGVPAQAQQTAVDVELVLAVDASGSVSQERFLLQQRGYVAAFRDPRLLQAIRSGSARSIGVTMTQWTGPAMQIQVVPWAAISDEASMLAFADAIEKAPRQLFGGGTSISGAIEHAMTLFAKSEYKGARRVIDIRATAPTTADARRPTHATRPCRQAWSSTACRFSRWSPFSTSTTGPMSSAGLMRS